MINRVGDLTDELRRRADLRGQTARHPDADLRRSLSQSFRGLRQLITRSSDVFIEGSEPEALPTTPPDDGELFLEVAWPESAIAIYGVDVLCGTRWVDLDPVRFASRRDYREGGRPRAFCIRSLPREQASPADPEELSAGVIQIYPLNTEGLDYRIWYLPEFAELEDPDHVVQGYDGDWIEWVLWDSTIKYAAEDDDVQNVDQIAVRERSIIEQRMLTSMNRVQRAAPIAIRRARSEWY